MDAPHSLWRATVPEPGSFPALERNLSVDVAIIGGGYTGLSAACHLAEAGASVALVEARSIGFGGSGRNVGLVNAGLWVPPDSVEARLGTPAGTRLNAALAEGPEVVFDLIARHQIRCEAVRNGTLHCAHSAAGLRDLTARFAQQQARGAPVALLDPAQTASRTGTTAYLGALWDGRAGTIQPLAYAQGLARVARQYGAQIFEHSPALAVSRTGDGWSVSTPKGTLRAARLIQATNAYGAGRAGQNPVIPAHFFQLATAPLPVALQSAILSGREGCWDTAPVLTSLRMEASGRLLLGALGNLDGPGRGPHAAWARRKLEKLFPQLRGIGFDHAWTGRIAMTTTHLPCVHSLGPKAVSIFGYSGRGIGPGTVFGRAAAQWALGTGDFPVAITDPAPEPAVALKAAALETGAVLTHLVGARH
ncbi:FAD-binding oxidoreductase [Meridianimarinicoccus sp. MJW13]|nr:FAD-binding oxidoreductase [Fluviibacterium sp. MJW13]